MSSLNRVLGFGGWLGRAEAPSGTDGTKARPSDELGRTTESKTRLSDELGWRGHGIRH